ncbi:hypothetical protein PG993_013188 [Apiospora rasikravindrae]|uniref:Uncharacterized protein n=1 Tax=Apiospora rasikravindrae TaxID=990691 RepID=A0ABR1RWW6_9PEZI
MTDTSLGVWAYAVELAKRHQAHGVVRIALNPGNLKSDLFRSQGYAMKIMNSMMLYPVPSGAATQLFAALSPQVSKETSLSGSWGTYENKDPSLAPVLAT